MRAPGSGSPAVAVAGATAAVSASDPHVGEAAVAVPGVGRATGGDSDAASGHEVDTTEEARVARAAREPRRDSSPALRRRFPLVYPLLQWLLSR